MLAASVTQSRHLFSFMKSDVLMLSANVGEKQRRTMQRGDILLVRKEACSWSECVGRLQSHFLVKRWPLENLNEIALTTAIGMRVAPSISHLQEKNKIN